MRNIVEGTPFVLSQTIRLERHDVMAFVRARGGPNIDRVQHAIFERNGNITLIIIKDG